MPNWPEYHASCNQGWLKAQASKATALGLKVSKASKKFNMFQASKLQKPQKNLIYFRTQGLKALKKNLILILL